jgi:colanic acid/amylovoran biosynthesis glycosyltransferase
MRSTHRNSAAVAHYTSLFLTPSQTFIYAQVTGLVRHRPVVLANRRLNEGQFPWSKVYVFKDWRRPKWYRLSSRVGLGVAQLQAIAFVLPLIFERVTLVHCHFGEWGVRMLPLQRLLHFPMIVSFYGYDATTYPRRTGVKSDLRRLFDSASLVTVLTNHMWTLLLNLGCPAEKLRLLPQGVDLSKFRGVERPDVSELTVLTIANFVEKKGLVYLIEAISLLRARQTPVRCRIIGDGPLRLVLENLVRELGVEDIVEMPGFAEHSDLPDHMAWANLYVQPSVTAADGDQEGLPTAIMEAMATGLPAVGTRHAGIPDLILERETGLLVDERDAEGLAEAMAVLRNYTLRARLGEAARLHVERSFDQRRQLEKLEDLYDELLGA